MLTTWNEIRDVLSRYPVRGQQPNVMTIELSLRDGEPGLLFQVVSTELAGRACIVLGVNVLPETQVVLGAALRLNSNLVHGALTAFRGWVMLRHVMNVGRFDADELRAVLVMMAFTVEYAQAQLAQRPSPVAATFAD